MEGWKKVAALMLQHAPINAVMESLTSDLTLEWPSYQSQINLVQHVFKTHFNNEKFPPSLKYMSTLVKKLYESIENSYLASDPSFSFVKEQECDMFADEFIEIVMKWKIISNIQYDVDDDVAYYTFFAPTANTSISNNTLLNYNPVHIKVLRVSKVGARVWKASYYLTDLLLACKDMVAGKKVLELGSGVGNAMLTIAACAESHVICDEGTTQSYTTTNTSLLFPRDITVTDFDHTVLKLLQYNVDLNSPIDRPRHCPVHVRRINWLTLTDAHACQLNRPIDSDSFGCDILQYNCVNLSDDTCFDICHDDLPSTTIATEVDPIDVILAADCNYSEDINEALADSIEKLLVQSVAARQSNSGGTTNSPDSHILQSYLSVATTNNSKSVSTSEQSVTVPKIPICLQQYPYALVVATQRQESTLQQFLDTVATRTSTLILEEVTQSLGGVVRSKPSTSYLYYDASDIRVFCIRPT